MKILKEGKVRKWTAECPKCEAVLEFIEGDIQTHNPTISDMETYGDVYPVNYIKCPVCGEIIFESQFLEV